MWIKIASYLNWVIEICDDIFQDLLINSHAQRVNDGGTLNHESIRSGGSHEQRALQRMRFVPNTPRVSWKPRVEPKFRQFVGVLQKSTKSIKSTKKGFQHAATYIFSHSVGDNKLANVLIQHFPAVVSGLIPLSCEFVCSIVSRSKSCWWSYFGHVHLSLWKSVEQAHDLPFGAKHWSW